MTHTPTARRCVLASAALAAASLLAAHPALAGDQAPRLLIDRDFRERPVSFLGLDGNEIVYLRAGSERRQPVSAWAVLLAETGQDGRESTRRAESHSEDAHPAARPVEVSLVDGQRFFGLFPAGPISADDTESDPEALIFESERWGVISVDLESLASLRFLDVDADVHAAPRRQAPSEDTLYFLNGDVVGGFLEHLGTAVTLETASGARDFDIELLAGVSLANPRTRPKGRLAWLAHNAGSNSAEPSPPEVVRFSDATYTSGGTRLVLSDVRVLHEAEGGTVLDPRHILGIAFDAGEVIALTDLSHHTARAIGDRVRAGPPEVRGANIAPLGVGSLSLTGPVEVRWSLPAGVGGLIGRLELPEASRSWGDFEVVIMSGPGDPAELERIRLHGDRTEASLGVRLPPGAGELIIRVEQGDYGPVHNRVRLHRPLLLRAPDQRR